MQPKVLRKLTRPRGGYGRGGFTLVEVLVVLAILVILFGLLFAPMMAGMDMATTGRAHARLQDTVRLAAEQMRRELATAMYVYPPPTYSSTSGPITDYAQLVFVLPASDSNGDPLTPRQPRTLNGEYLVTRYYVKPPTVNASRQYDEANPFVLVRQEGLYRFNATLGRYEFGSIDPVSTNFVVDRAMAQNSITPTENYDIPASSTLCLDCGQLEIGYVATCPQCSSTNLHYLHDDVKFRPERIVGEALVPSENNTVYKARHGNWMGTPNNGTVALATGAALSATAPELQPRLVDYRWNTDGYRQIALDSFTPNIRSDIRLRWNTTNGRVQIGDWCTVHVHVDASTDPGLTYWPLTVSVVGGSGTGDSYDAGGNLSGAQTSPLVPIYPRQPTGEIDPRMPIAYRLDPGFSDSTTNIAAKIVPNSTRVFVSASPSSGQGGNRGEYVHMQGASQNDLEESQYSEFVPDDQQWAEIRFNRLSPPSPDRYAGMSLPLFDLYITYYYRRNFDPVTYRDDVIYADYSTGEIINITLIPQRFVDLQPYKAGLPNLVLPPDLPLGGVPVHTQAVVANARY